LNDEESKKQYLNQLKYRLQINFDCIPVPDTKNQYFPNDIIHLKENEVFLDAGAYDGDTFIEFSNRVNNKYDKYIALEPDPQNYEQIKLNLHNKINVIIDPYAVGAKHEFLKFSSTGGEGASINNNGDISVECVSIDEKYYHFKPTFLKFDIEGAELDALRGAVKVIKDLTPKIAVCIYHKPEDIFEIPLWIHAINPNYNFHVRTHGADGFEFVLYAIPKT
jgi:FkbM family methyltransferase